MKLALVASVVALALAGCQSTQTTTLKQEVEAQAKNQIAQATGKVKAEPKEVGKPDFDSYDQSRVERAINQASTLSNYIAISYRDLCTPNYIDNGIYNYFNWTYNRGGSVEQCYQTLAEKVAPLNNESIDGMKALLIDYDLKGGKAWVKMAKDPKYAKDDIWKKKAAFYEPVKELAEWASKHHRVNSTAWTVKEGGDEFEGYTSKYVHPLVTKGGEQKMDFGISFECRVTATKKKLMLTWRVEDAIATPSSNVELAVIFDKPVKFKSNLYSNSYRSGYSKGDAALKVANHILAGNDLKMRVSGDTSYHDFKYSSFTDNSKLQEVLDYCK